MSALVLCAAVFGLALYVVLTRRELIAVLAGAELMLGAANVQLVSFASASGVPGESAQALALMVLVVAAAEAGVGLAIIVTLSRRSARSRTDDLQEVNG
ncbi:MAG: NADH-quinone oxidoreductase subunit NuoK [Actinomycetota bacterium]|nr:NADH-quinone oxidoreductase subunit NuoK [Actinomycetota bacterium]